MVIYCSAINCSNHQHSNKDKLKFHPFPLKNDILCKKWILAVRKNNWKPTRFSFICGEHFTDYDYKTKCKRYLKPNAVPSIFNFYTKTDPQHPLEEATKIIDTDSSGIFLKPQSTVECSARTSDSSKCYSKRKQTQKTVSPIIPSSCGSKEVQTNKYKYDYGKAMKTLRKRLFMEFNRRSLLSVEIENIYMSCKGQIPDDKRAIINENLKELDDENWVYKIIASVAP